MNLQQFTTAYGHEVKLQTQTSPASALFIFFGQPSSFCQQLVSFLVVTESMKKARNPRRRTLANALAFRTARKMQKIYIYIRK